MFLKEQRTLLLLLCRRHNPHNETNVNGKQMVNFALGRDLAVMET
jgi:hypothetical protein